MFHFADQDLIARLELGTAPTVGDEIDGLRGAPGEDDLLASAGLQKVTHLVACGLEGIRGFLAQRMDAAVNIGIQRFVIVALRLDHRARFLAGRRVVQIDQRAPVQAWTPR